jgi:arylsulfatase A-like enzyme
MRRPNILLLITDQQRWDALGANGNRDIQTPHLDRLAAEGVNFDHCFVQNPVCMPSRVSLLTGQYPGTLGITQMGVPVPPETVTLPRLLRNAGYRSANIGKLHFLPHANRDHRTVHPDYGFDQLEIADEPGPYDDAYRAWVRRIAPDQLDLISLGLPPTAETWQRTMGIADPITHPEERFPLRALPFRGRSGLTHTAFVAEQTEAFIAENQGRPWLCVAGFYSPHSPWVAPQEFLDRYDPATFNLPAFPPEVEARRGVPLSGAAHDSSTASVASDDELRAARHGYYAMVSEVDHHIGRLLATLDETGQADETIVIFTSDHGEWLGEHLRYGKGYPGDDAVSRVPLIVRWPGGQRGAGRTVEAIVELVDLVPTILDCAAVPVAPHLQGQSLAGLLADEPGEAAGHDTALMEQSGWKTLRTAQVRYRIETDGREALFDLARDPGEYHDVAAEPDYADALATARRQLLQRLLDRERPLTRTWTY